jgi:hypothetical protein
MRRKIYLRFTLILSLFVLLAMSSITGSQPRAAAPDVCSEQCIHECKVEFEECLAAGNRLSFCKDKYQHCIEQRCNCAD